MIKSIILIGRTYLSYYVAQQSNYWIIQIKLLIWDKGLQQVCWNIKISAMVKFFKEKL